MSDLEKPTYVRFLLSTKQLGKRDSYLLVPEDDANFARFWDAYPKRVAKKEARKAWAQIQPQPTSETVDRMIATLAWQCRDPQWGKDGGQFVPYPASWLRAERWDDEPVNVPILNERTARTLAAGAAFVEAGKE